MHKSVVGVLLIFVVVGVVGCAAYDKFKNLEPRVRTDPLAPFTLETTDNISQQDVSSEDWDEYAEDIESVEKIEVSYKYQSDKSVTVSIYISDNPNLTANNVAASAELLHQIDLEATPGDEWKTVYLEEVAGEQDIEEVLREYNGTFYVYMVISDDASVTISEFSVYPTLSLDVL